MSETSYVWMLPEIAAAMAEAKLVSIKQWRERRVKAFVKARTEELNKGFWRRTFRMKPLTEAEVEEMERSMPDLWANTIWEIENWDGRSQELLCEKIIKLAKLNRPLQLSLEDAHRIQEL